MWKHFQSMHIYLNILNMLKDSQYICVHIISTAVCHVQFSFLIASAHHSPPKKFYSLFLLLLACAKVYTCSLSENQAAIQFTCRLANLHDMYMPSKILLKNAQIMSP